MLAHMYFSDSFKKEDAEFMRGLDPEESYCDSLVHCFLTLVNNGLRNG